MSFKLDFKKLVEITQGDELQFVSDVEIHAVVTDSRKVSTADINSLFFAIKGIHHNGHDFLQDLYHLGFRNFVVEEVVNPDKLPEANILMVRNSIIALQSIAIHKRKELEIPVIGITGSNAKTLIKEWLYQLLSPKYNVLRSPKSYNSQLGVPLSVLLLNEKHDLAIFEAGISTTNEMSNLAKVISPTLGIFTNIGTAHEEGFNSTEEKIQEKLQLFKNTVLIIYCKDHALIDQAILANASFDGRCLTWSFHQDSDIKIRPISEKEFELEYLNEHLRLSLPFSDLASQENLFHCIALMLHMGFDDIQSKILSLKPVRMRLEMKRGINNCYIVDDSYNNDLAGLEIALQFLQSQNQRSSKTLVLSDILQSSLNTDQLYSKVNDLLKGRGVDRIIGIGPQIQSAQSTIQTPGQYFNSTEEFLSTFQESTFQNETVLVKGARDFKLERVVSKLEEKFHETVLEIDLDALTHNLNFYRSRLNRSTKMMIMVKALAYGSGISEISNLLQFHKVDYLAVAYTDEGIEIRKNGVNLPIMVMNPKDDLGQLLEHKLEPEVFSIPQLRGYADELKVLGKSLSIHLNINTGMNRLGIELSQCQEASSIIRNSRNIKVASIFTHLAGSDAEVHREFSLNQLQEFQKAATEIEKSLGHKVLKHALNSAGILNFPEFQFDMVRLGIGLHGFDPAKNSQELISVSSLKTVISQIKHLKRGDTIGYSRKGVAENDMCIATIAIGYADGFTRAFGNGVGEVLVNGKRSKVIGNVCMDMTMINITGIEANEGDEVTIFGKDLSILEVSKWIETIPYEILTNVSSRVKRIYFTN